MLLTKCLRNGGVTCKLKVLSSFHVLCRGQDAASKARHCANTNVGSNRARTNLCFKKTDDNFSNKDFPRRQVNGSADKLDFEKIKTWDRLKINTADPSHF